MLHLARLLVPLAMLLGAGGANAATAGPAEPAEPQDWVVLVYGGSDNDSEESFCPDMEELRQGLAPGTGVEVFCLVDRSPKYSSATDGFGEDFSDARLYRLGPDRAQRLDGRPQLASITLDSTFEADSGDAALVRDYIRWAKANHPAKRYALIFYTHGGGDSWCPDETTGGESLLRPTELATVLGPEDSLDLVVFDVCGMATLEDAYEWRPRAGRFSIDVMVATPMAGYPFPWRHVFSRLRKGGAEGTIDPATATAEDFGRLVVEETKQGRLRDLARAKDPSRSHAAGESMACLRLDRAQAAKEALDALGRALAECSSGGDDPGDAGRDLFVRERGTATAPKMLAYSPGPYLVDVHDLASHVARADGAPEPVQIAAAALALATDELVVSSFGGPAYDPFGGFREGEHGVQVRCPPGGLPWRSVWSQMTYLFGPEADDGRRVPECFTMHKDGATPGDGKVSNWFEWLDCCFDPDDEDGGLNGYAR